jgi:hypothetical protein
MLTELTTQIRVQSGVAATSSVEVGDALDEILLASERADVLGLRARGLNPIREPLLVTTAERLLRKCKRPVRVVKQPPPSGYGGALVGVDLSMHSVAGVELALRAAPTARISAVHAFDVRVFLSRSQCDVLLETMGAG